MQIDDRVRIHAALADATRLAAFDALTISDRSPRELAELLRVPTNLLSHHLDRLEDAGLIRRVASSGDGRRRYVQLTQRAAPFVAASQHGSDRALFLCSHNSARSQLAAALWQARGGDADSAGTEPADRIHPGALAAADRVGLAIGDASPKHVGEVGAFPALVVTVCDRAHEELVPSPHWLHWSIPDPAETNDPTVFDAVVSELSRRIDRIMTNPKETQP